MKPLDNELKVVQQLTGAKPDQIIFENFGWSSRVYLVNNGEFVIKFPRSEKVKKEYEREVKVLRLLEANRLNVQIPKVRWMHENHDYLGFEGIIGRPIDRLSVKPDDQMEQYIGEQVGLFVKQLHSFTLDGMRRLSVEDEIAQFQTHYQDCQSIIDAHFSEQEKTMLYDFVYRTFPVQLAQFENDSVLCHGDLGYWNIIYKTDGSLGVIDFGDVGYYDRSKDFIGMMDEAALRSALKKYGDSSLLRQKITLRKKLFWMPDLKFFSDKGNERGIITVVARIKTALQ